MLTPLSRAERLCAMFDSYCKTVLRNAGYTKHSEKQG